MLLGLAIAGLAITLYAFAFTVFTLLEDMPLDYIWGSLFILIVCAWVYYAKWLWSQWRRVRRERWLKKDRVRLAQGVAPLPQYPPNDMAALERDVHDWDQSGAGSLAGSVIGLEAADAHLEGDM